EPPVLMPRPIGHGGAEPCVAVAGGQPSEEAEDQQDDGGADDDPVTHRDVGGVERRACGRGCRGTRVSPRSNGGAGLRITRTGRGRRVPAGRRLVAGTGGRGVSGWGSGGGGRLLVGAG